MNGATQPTHCGCSSPSSKYECVTLVWPNDDNDDDDDDNEDKVVDDDDVVVDDDDGGGGGDDDDDDDDDKFNNTWALMYNPLSRPQIQLLHRIYQLD